MNRAKGFLKRFAMIFVGPLRQLFVRVSAPKYDKDGSISEAYIEKVNDAIPEFTAKFVDKILDSIYPPEKYELGLCHRIWSTEKLIYALLWYKYYSPTDIDHDTFFD